jgi:ATP-binding cassette subfamily B (MDR/TAP) protein 1
MRTSAPTRTASTSFEAALQRAERDADAARLAAARARASVGRAAARARSWASHSSLASTADQQEQEALRASLDGPANDRAKRRAAGRASGGAGAAGASGLWAILLGEGHGDPAVPLRTLYSFTSCADGLLLLTASFFALASGLCLPATLYFFAGTMDSVGNAMAGGYDSAALRSSSVRMVQVGLVYIGCTAAYAGLADISKAHQMAEYKKRYLRSFLRQDVGWYDVSRPHELASRFGEAMLAIEEGVSFKGMMLLEACYTLVFCFAIGFYYGWDVCAVVFAASPLAGISGGAAILVALSAGSRIADAYAAAGAVASETIGSMRTVASLGLERSAAARYERRLARAERFGIAFVWQAGLAMSAMVASIAVMMCAGLLYGGLGVAAEQQATAFEYAVDVTWDQMFESMGMLDEMRAKLQPPSPPNAPDAGQGGGVWGGLGVDWGGVVGAVEGAAAWAASAAGFDRVHYKYCTYDCGDQYNMLNLDFQSTIGLVTQVWGSVGVGRMGELEDVGGKRGWMGECMVFVCVR